MTILAEKEVIESRYEAVDELLDNIELYTSLQNALTKYPDVERAITLCVQLPRFDSEYPIHHTINIIIISLNYWSGRIFMSALLKVVFIWSFPLLDYLIKEWYL